MILMFYIPPDNLVDTYDRICRLLRGNDGIIFDAMTAVDQSRRSAFVPPASPSEFGQKHTEIRGWLRSPGMFQGRQTAMALLEEIWKRIQALGGVPGVSTTELLDTLAFRTNDEEVVIRLTPDARWAAEWSVSLRYGRIAHESKISVDLYDANYGEVVPTYVLEYVACALYSYRRGRSAVAVALLSIVVEATLRDVLATRNYGFGILYPSGRQVRGLGQALDIARNEERFLTIDDLPTDFDEVICTVRNNLIHLSGDALGTPLIAIDPSGDFTLEQFLADEEKVYDLIISVLRLINKQYIELRMAGHLAA